MATAPTETTKKSLVTKLAEVMGVVGYIQKTGRNNFHNYTYATEADIVSAVRKELAERRVMMIPSVEKVEFGELLVGKDQKKHILATLTVRFTFFDGDSGEKIDAIAVGQGSDAGDKAVYKAMTGAEKYALLKTFLIPTGDDPEADDDEEQKPSKNHEQKPAAPERSPEKTKAADDRVKPLWRSIGGDWPSFMGWVSKVIGNSKGYYEWTDAEWTKVEAAAAQRNSQGQKSA